MPSNTSPPLIRGWIAVITAIVVILVYVGLSIYLIPLAYEFLTADQRADRFSAAWSFGVALLLLISLTVAIVAALDTERWFGRDASAVIAGFLMSALIVPGIASLVTTISFVLLDKLAPPAWRGLTGELAVSAGILAALFGWLLLALLCRRFTFADRAYPHGYSELRERAKHLKARLDQLRPLYSSSSEADLQHDLSTSPPSPLVQSRDLLSEQIAFSDAEAHYAFVASELGLEPADARPSAGMQWVSLTGYVTAINYLHSAEEALLLIEPNDEVVRSAFFDELRLGDSTIPNRDNLLAKLRDARKLLAKSTLFDDTSAQPGSGILQSPRSEQLDPQEELEARAVLRMVRQSLNQFRDNRRGGLVRARNRLVKTGIMTGVAAYLLLAIAVIAGTGVDALIAAAAFYLVGAMIGLFNRLRLETQSEEAIEDYGLTSARLLCTPLFSGVAGITGVVLVAMLPIVFNTIVVVPQPSSSTQATVVSTPSPLPAQVVPPIATPAALTQAVTATETLTATTQAATPPQASVGPAPAESPAESPARSSVERSVPLRNIFDLGAYPFGLIIAAIFGLTPGLLIDRLRWQTEQYKLDLQSTEASERSPKTRP
jgi:hypothetical protein